MDSAAEEIWIKRLRKDVDSGNITDTESLLKEIDDTPNSYTTKTGKTVDLTQPKQNLKTFVNDLISGSGSLQDTIFDNNTSDLAGATTKDAIKDIENRFVNIPKIDTDRKQLFRGEVAVRERELLKEAPEDLTKEQISETGLRSIRKLSSELDLTIDETKTLLIDKGFTLFSNDKQFKA